MDPYHFDETFFDATQIAVFKVDDDVRVNECNMAASHLLASAASRAFNERLLVAATTRLTSSRTKSASEIRNFGSLK